MCSVVAPHVVANHKSCSSQRTRALELPRPVSERSTGAGRSIGSQPQWVSFISVSTGFLVCPSPHEIITDSGPVPSVG